MKLNYLIIPLCVFLVAFLGNLLTTKGISGWYKTLKLPSIAPPGAIIGGVWTLIFILGMIAVLLFWNPKPVQNFEMIVILLIVNGILNILWSYLFFNLHLLGWPIVEMIILNLTTIALIILLGLSGKIISGILLIPYFLWVTFATYLAYTIYLLNR